MSRLPSRPLTTAALPWDHSGLRNPRLTKGRAERVWLFLESLSYMRKLGRKEVIYSRKLRELEAELKPDPKGRAEELVLTLSQGLCA